MFFFCLDNLVFCFYELIDLHFYGVYVFSSSILFVGLMLCSWERWVLVIITQRFKSLKRFLMKSLPK